MKFKSACKHWLFLIEQDQQFIDFYNTRSRTRQQHNSESTTTATLFITPVMILSGVSRDRSMEDDVNREIKMIFLSHNHHGGRGSSSVAAHVHTFSSDITIPVPKRKDVAELVSDHTTLEPVHGLVCFLNLDNYGSVLLYNPSTREKTAWIRTGISEWLEEVFLDQTRRGVELDMLDMKTLYHCMFGFGFDSATKKHKVLCIYKIHQLERQENDGCWAESGRATCCEVMTVGENIWREIDDIPSFIEDMEIEQQCKSVHVNGYICWMCYEDAPELRELCDVIMVFDVGSETFGMISIPTLILEDLWRLSWEERVKKWTNEIVEIDGHLAILNIKKYKDKDHWINLWILEDEIKINSDDGTSDNNVAGCGEGNWVLETLQMPYPWDELNYLAFKAITGTDLIIVSYFLNENSSLREQTKNEVLYCYNRKEKKCYRKQVDMIKDHSCPYEITTLFDTLTPVQTNI